MRNLINPDSRALEIAVEGFSATTGRSEKKAVQWAIEAFLETHGAKIERNRISPTTIEERIISPWRVLRPDELRNTTERLGSNGSV